MNYIPYHIHSDYSLLDSCTQYKEYVDKAVELGMEAIAFSEHGRIGGWFKKMNYCKEKGIKYIHAVECYLTKSLSEKVRDNYHTVLIAKNKKGFEELNEAIGRSFDKDHFYYTNRVSFDEFLNLSDNIITTSACLASPLNKLSKDDPYYTKLINRYDYLEIQHHNDPDQKAFNIDLACLAKEYNKPLIAGTDSHSLDDYKNECRTILMKYKKQSYPGEENFDMTFKSYDELVEAYVKQDTLPIDLCIEAINNTSAMAAQIEDYEIDCSTKYPILYGSAEKDHEKFVETVDRKFKEKIDKGAIPASQIEAYKEAIEEELAVFTKTGMDGFMLSMSEILEWCHNNGIVTGPARGSVAGSRIAYITDIIDLNPETWHTVFSRFANADRVEVGDIDTDVIEEDRPRIFEYLRSRFGHDCCARVAAFGTIADRAAIDLIGGALRETWAANNPNLDDNLNPYSLDTIKEIKKEWATDTAAISQKYGENKDEYKLQMQILLESYILRYPEIFKYYKGMVGTKVSQSIHPAGMVIAPCSLRPYGVFDKDGDDCLFLDMDECHDLGLVKYDFLCLVNVKIIKETCEMCGLPYPSSDKINWEDEQVWNDMLKSSLGIFQMESEFAFRLLSQFHPKTIPEMSLVTASIRPAGASYRNSLMAREYNYSGSDLIDKILKDNYGNLVYQEDVIRFLREACGFTGSEADTLRRAIAHKKEDKIQALLPKVIEGYCEVSTDSREKAEADVRQFVKVIEDASKYMFGYNHSVAYCLIGYLCAYLRYYHPLEFITSLLNNARDQDDIAKFTELARIYNIAISNPRYGSSRSNYSPDKEHHSIAKGVSSIKFISEDVAESLYNIAHSSTPPETFVDLLHVIKTETKINSRQLDILIKIDFFSEFGNSRELDQIYKMFSLSDFGTKKSIGRDKFNNPDVINIIEKYAKSVDKNNNPLKTFKFDDFDQVISCANEIEVWIKSLKLKDISPKLRIANYMDTLGYVPATNEESDRMTLIVQECTPAVSNNGSIWQYRASVQSLGSGKIARLSIAKNLFDSYPIKKGDIVTAKDLKRDSKGYWHLANYSVW